MARVSPIYPTFARGEVSPLMFGRVDIEPYSSCLDKCRNCVVRPFGVVSRISGTEYITNAKGRSRLLKFVFSAKDSYIIECGAGYFRFFNNGAYIVNNDQTPYEIVNDYTEAELASIQYVQLDDVIKLVCRDDANNANKPKELIRRAGNDWVFRDVDFVCTPFLDENTSSTTITPSATNGDITLTASADIFSSKHVGSYWWLNKTKEVDGITKQGFVKITSYTDARHVGANVQWTLSGTEATKQWGEGAWSDYRGYPSAIGLMDGRLYYGRTPYAPRNIYGSHPYGYEDFTPAIDNEDDGAINIELATNSSGDGSDIQWLVGANFILSGTYGNEFVVKGSGDASITPTDVSARARSNWGSENIQPITIGSFIHFVQRTGKKVRQFVYDYYLDSYKAVDVSLYSEHLLESPIVDIAYQKSPDSILWCLREDGKLAGLTIEPDQQVQAWHLMEYENAQIESIETISSYDGLYDELYMIVKKNINGQEVRHVERIQNPITPDVQAKCWYVRDGLAYNAFKKTDGITLTLSGVSGNITATASDEVFSSSMVGRRIRLVDENMDVLGEATITGYTSETSVNAVVNKKFPTGTLTGGTWGISVQTISNLSHLIGEEVQIFADGAVQAPKTVDNNGAVLMELDAFYIIAGLKYQSYIRLMPLEGGSQNGTSTGKLKRVNELSMRVWKTSGVRVGKDLNSLETVKFRDTKTEMGLPQPLYTGIISNIKYNQGWVWDANITIEQSEPLPMNILAVAPIINEVDK